MSDRRDHPRARCLLKVAVRAGLRTFDGTVISLSESGAYIAGSERIALGDQVRLRFRRPRDAELVELDGEVVRVVPRPQGMELERGFAVRFDELLADAEPEGGESGVYPVPSLERAEATHAAPERPTRIRAPRERTRPAARRAPEAPAPRQRARDSRFVTTIHATLVPMTGQDAPRDVELTNVSRHGLFVACTPPPPDDEVFTLRIEGWEVDGHARPLELVIQISWQAPGGDGTSLPGAGCKIIAFGDERARARYEGLLRGLLLVGNPIVGR